MLRTSTDFALSSLDPELLMLAFSFLPHHERTPLSLVCKKWHQVNQMPLLKETEEEIYLAFFLNRFDLNMPMVHGLSEEKITNAVRQKRFSLYWGAEAKTKEELLTYLMPRFNHEYNNGNANTGNIYFMTRGKLEGDKLSISSCEALKSNGETLKVIHFSPPVICNKSNLKVSGGVYELRNPDFERFRSAEYKKQQAALKTKEGKEEQSHTKVTTGSNQVDNPQTQTLTTRPVKKLDQPSVSTANTTLFVKPKPAPSTSTSHSVNRKPMKPAPGMGPGSCSIS